MKSFKSHMGVILSLFTLLFSIQFNFFINDAIKKYEKNMVDNYSIVLISKKALSLEDVASSVSEVSFVEEIVADSILLKLRDKISKTNLEKLSERLPKFYNIKLKFFPDNNELQKISERLNIINGVSRVEIFKKAHDNIYKILILLKNIVYIFSSLIGILSFMLIVKQMKIWLFEHSQRVEVMTLFGASFYSKSAELYKMAIFDSILATFIVMVFYTLLLKLTYFHSIIDIINFEYDMTVLVDYFIYLLSIGLVLSVLSATLVMVNLERKNKI